jgi:Amidohydrolase family
LSMHHEMEMLVEAGLTPMQALKAATSWPAELLQGKNGARGTAKIGSIRPGNFADLVVVSADPLSDISNTKKIERVMKKRTLDRPGLPSRVFHVCSSPPVRSSRRTLRPRSARWSQIACRKALRHFMWCWREADLRQRLWRGCASRPTRSARQWPAQNVGIIGYRFIAVSVFNPPPDGGVSNAVYQLILPK